MSHIQQLLQRQAALLDKAINLPSGSRRIAVLKQLSTLNLEIIRSLKTP